MKPQLFKRLAWSLAIISMVIMLAGITMSMWYFVTTGGYRELIFHQFLVPLSTTVYVIVGALVAARYPRNPIGWIFLAVGLLYSLLAWTVGYSLVGPAFGAQLADWLSAWIWVPTIVLPTTFIFLLFPDGRLLSPRWRLVAWSAALGLIAAAIGVAFHTDLIEPWGTALNLFGTKSFANILQVITVGGNVHLTIGLIGSVASLIVRFRRSKDIEREQMKWLAYAAGLMVLGIIMGSIMSGIWPDDPLVYELSIALTSLVVLAIALAACVAILRYRLYDINLIINRSLVYGTLTVGVVGLYVLIVGSVSLPFQDSGNLIISLVATGIVAVLFQPLRDRLQRAVNRLMYGERDDPVAVLSKLGQRLEATIAPTGVLPGIVETVAQTLKLPYVAISLRNGDENEVVAAFGLPNDQVIRLPLVYRAETIGQLEVTPRGQDETFSQADLAILEMIAHQAGTAVYAVQLTHALQQSRRNLVTTREEERRRLRRDLHDGLGPHLASQMLTIEAIDKLLKRDPAEAETLLQELKQQTRSAVSDIRRLVHDLRPPTLDDLGLIGALRESARQYGSNGLHLIIEAPEPLPPLPAAVEVATYRIAQEAMTNVVRHAQASRCEVQFRLADDRNGGSISLEIWDDGRGLPPDYRAGVGCQSMRERVAELGGQFSMKNRPGGGTAVQARLPL